MINSDGANICLVESRRFSRDRAHVTSLKVPRGSKISLPVIRCIVSSVRPAAWAKTAAYAFPVHNQGSSTCQPEALALLAEIPLLRHPTMRVAEAFDRKFYCIHVYFSSCQKSKEIAYCEQFKCFATIQQPLAQGHTAQTGPVSCPLSAYGAIFLYFSPAGTQHLSILKNVRSVRCIQT